uniref:Putative E3 ubiquitin-protein ligase RNF12-B-like n=1 Tax=Davidia involucrata TaxID=16924 RepID=A0A5B6ZR48_DAVIN
MAGMIPGAGLPSRRRIHSQHHHEDSPYLGHHSHRTWFEQSMITTTTTMDEATLRARQRLQERLGYLSPSRSSKIEVNQDRRHNRAGPTKDTRLGSRILRHFQFQLNSSKSDGQVCAVCLEDFQAEQQVMDLSCSHKYHSKCLLPWLDSHPNCPCCRTPVQS